MNKVRSLGSIFLIIITIKRATIDHSNASMTDDLLAGTISVFTESHYTCTNSPTDVHIPVHIVLYKTT